MWHARSACCVLTHDEIAYPEVPRRERAASRAKLERAPRCPQRPQGLSAACVGHRRRHAAARHLTVSIVRFARNTGYLTLSFGPTDNLQAAGFRLVDSQQHADFGVKLTAQAWALQL